MSASEMNPTAGFAVLGVDGAPDSPLVEMLMAPAIVPGGAVDYQLCKTIYAYHPLGAIIAEAPITLAQSKPRDIAVKVLGEAQLVERYQDTWDTIGKVGATVLLHNLGTLARIYGIASLGVGQKGVALDQPLTLNGVDAEDLFFNVLDPLNTSGSLVLNQDPNAADFLKPSGDVHVQGQRWHPSRLWIKMNERPLYISWSASAYGFVGRSAYQRALFPLKTFLQSMVTDQMVTQKAGLLVAKLANPGSFIDKLMGAFGGMKRATIRAGVTNQVLQIGLEEALETLDMKNLEGPAKYARDNVLKNIASACGMPATLIAQETMSAEMHEGAEDAKKEAQYLEFIRADLNAAYDFMDRIVMRCAWTEAFFETLKAKHAFYRDMPYETALHDWMMKFEASWPNLLTEPDSEKSKTADVQMKSVVAFVETIGPLLDPHNRAELITWAADNANEREELFASKLVIDTTELEAHLVEQEAQEVEMQEQAAEQVDKEPKEPKPFSSAA